MIFKQFFLPSLGHASYLIGSEETGEAITIDALRGSVAGRMAASPDRLRAARWHVPGAHHIPGGELPGRIEEVPRGRPIAVYCGGGYRSAVATSVLRRAGHERVFNVQGGFSAWKKLGNRVV